MAFAVAFAVTLLATVVFDTETFPAANGDGVNFSKIRKKGQSKDFTVCECAGK